MVDDISEILNINNIASPLSIRSFASLGLAFGHPPYRFRWLVSVEMAIRNSRTELLRAGMAFGDYRVMPVEPGESMS